MTQAKHIARSLTTLLEHPIVNCILDRSCDLEHVIPEVLGYWDYDLFTRKPSPAYDEYGLYQGTDLDLACFLYALRGRGAVINIPRYETHSKKQKRDDQMLTSTANRHGKVVNVGANKLFFNFNVGIIDENVVGEDKVGDFRSFSLTDKTGKWYQGWDRIQFVPTLRENRFITENKLWTGNRVIFRNFIHPNRWTSFFGHHFIITKMLIERLEDECKFLNTEVKRILAAGIEFPEGEGPKSHSYEYGESKRETFTAFEVKIFTPESQIEGDYELFPTEQASLVKAYNQRKYLLYSIVPALRFMTRASEFAHFQAPHRMPAWLKNVKWEPGFTIPPRGRAEWERLKLFQPKVGEHSISILKRSFEKSAEVGV